MKTVEVNAVLYYCMCFALGLSFLNGFLQAFA